MWEAFAACVERVRRGGAPDDHWFHIAALTQKVLCAVEASVQRGGALVQLAELD
jgi:hypothetical protein